LIHGSGEKELICVALSAGWLFVVEYTHKVRKPLESATHDWEFMVSWLAEITDSSQIG